MLFADLDALFLRSPAPILADGDIIGERIWGRPLSVVKRWDAAPRTAHSARRIPCPQPPAQYSVRDAPH